METDRSLAAFAGRFVPLKITTDGGPEWSQWARRYRSEGTGIPILFVVRADGEQLYGKSGALPGSQLPEMLTSTLQRSGRWFTDAEVELLASVAEEADKAVEEERLIDAARSLGRLTDLGTLGDLKSYSKLAIKVDSLAKSVLEKAEKRVADATAELDDTQTSFQGMLFLVEAETGLDAFPTLRSAVTQTLRSLKRKPELASIQTQAETILRARRYAKVNSSSSRKIAMRAYERIVQQYDGTDAGKLARDELAALDAGSALLTRPADGPPGPVDLFRTWSDASGSFQIRAKVVDVKAGWVQFQKEDGAKVAVPIHRLSEADQKLIQER